MAASTAMMDRRIKREQVARACQRCASSKRKCSGTFPCERCLRLGTQDTCQQVRTKREGEDDDVPLGGDGGGLGGLAGMAAAAGGGMDAMTAAAYHSHGHAAHAHAHAHAHGGGGGGGEMGHGHRGGHGHMHAHHGGDGGGGGGMGSAGRKRRGPPRAGGMGGAQEG